MFKNTLHSIVRLCQFLGFWFFMYATYRAEPGSVIFWIIYLFFFIYMVADIMKYFKYGRKNQIVIHVGNVNSIGSNNLAGLASDPLCPKFILVRDGDDFKFKSVIISN